MKVTINQYKSFLATVIKPYSAILFLNHKVAGFVILAITFINPSVAISGILAVVFTILFAKLIGMTQEYLYQGFYIYNSLLVGMGIGYIFTPSFISIVLIAICSAFTFMLSFMLNRLFSNYNIPILSLPFSIVTIFIYLASLKYGGLISTLVNNATIYDIDLPLLLSGFLKSFGTIFFLPNNIAGFLLLMLVLYFSRIIFIMSAIGYYVGILFHSFLIGSYQLALYDPYAFNYILVAIALCGIFLLPTLKSFLFSLIGIAISVVLTDAIIVLFNYYSIPVFTIPFNLTVITSVFILSIIYYEDFNFNIKATPEKSLIHRLSMMFRFGDIYTKISLPFSGKWVVYQGFDDTWTHKGKYKYAYDFVQKIDNKTYMRDGLQLEDYYAFGKSILSPIEGYVIDCRHDLIDNFIGSVDRVNNWGNYIIIKSSTGFFVEISHLMQYSLSVKVGDFVKLNDPLAKCGNSGYSPEPHIHIQVQGIGVIGGFTKKFCFTEYYLGDTLVLNGLPNKEEIVEPVIIDKSITSRFLFVLDDTFSYNVLQDGHKIDEIELIARMNDLGEFYLEDIHGNKLYFYNDLMQFYFYAYAGEESYLKWLFMLVPRVPFINKENIKYKDYLPIELVYSSIKTICIELLSVINKKYAKIEKDYIYNTNTITSENGIVVISETNKGFDQITYQNTQLQRIK